MYVEAIPIKGSNGPVFFISGFAILVGYPCISRSITEDGSLNIHYGLFWIGVFCVLLVLLMVIEVVLSHFYKTVFFLNDEGLVFTHIFSKPTVIRYGEIESIKRERVWNSNRLGHEPIGWVTIITIKNNSNLFVQMSPEAYQNYFELMDIIKSKVEAK